MRDQTFLEASFTVLAVQGAGRSSLAANVSCQANTTNLPPGSGWSAKRHEFLEKVLKTKAFYLARR
jgi:hypothetical protein